MSEHAVECACGATLARWALAEITDGQCVGCGRHLDTTGASAARKTT